MAAPEPLRYTAFPAGPAGGNPAGFVLDASGLTDLQMLAIAAEVGCSETAFVVAVPEPGHYRVRWEAPM